MSIPFNLRAAAVVLALSTVCAFSQTEAVWPYHPNRPGAEAYFHGGAFTAHTGSVTAMLFNPAGLAEIPGRFSFLIESGWHSQTEYLDFFNYNFASDFLPVQFAAAAFRPNQKISAGVFYSQPTNYQLDLRPPDETGTDEPNLQREYDVVGAALSAELEPFLFVGGEVEWRQARLQDRLSLYTADGKVQDWRFSLGVITSWNDWQLGLAARSKYEAHGEQSFEPPLFTHIDPLSGKSGANRPHILPVQNTAVVVEEPATLRFGITSPPMANRLHLSAEAEYHDFDSNSPNTRWQFYGGGLIQLSSALDLGLGCFTFRKDYSVFIDGPQSEVFLTAGGALKIAGLRLIASYMDGDLFNTDFQGQRFFSLALGYVIQ